MPKQSSGQQLSREQSSAREQASISQHEVPDAVELGRAVELFRALGHEARLAVLLCLSHSSGSTVSELQELIGIEQSALSHQLRALREARLVRTRRSGRNVFYELYDDHVRHLVTDAVSHVREERLAVVGDAERRLAVATERRD